MKILLLISLALLATASLSAMAEEASGEPEFTVEVDPSVYPQKAFSGKQVNTGEIPSREPRPDALPNKKEREAAFALVPGLDSDIAKMDELDRDLLFVRARTKPLKELMKDYPAIPAAKLSRLQRELARK